MDSQERCLALEADVIRAGIAPKQLP